MQQSSETTGSGVILSRHTSTSSVPVNSNRTEMANQPSSANTGENGNVFTLTNIYTFGVNGNSNAHPNPSSDNYRINSFVEVFDQPSPSKESDYERHYRETHSSSSSSITRKIQTNFNDKHHYELSGSYFYVI